MQILRLKDIINTDIDVNRIVCTNQHWSGKQRTWSYLNSPRPCDGLIYISHGGAIYTSENGQSVTAKCGDILYLPKKSRYFVEFELSASRSMLLNFMLYHKNDEAVFSDKIFVAAHDEDSTLHDIFDTMCDIYSRSTDILTLKSKLFSLLYALSQSTPHDETISPVHTAITHINNHLNEIPSVAELAKMCAMSKSTISP